MCAEHVSSVDTAEIDERIQRLTDVVRLPPGRPVSAQMWVSDEVVLDWGEAWLRLVEAFPSSGLWPVIVSEPIDVTDSFTPDEIYPSPKVPALLLAERYSSLVSELGSDAEAFMAPLPLEFPGLAPSTPDCDAPVEEMPARRFVGGHMGLVAARRPAEIPLRLGWAPYNSELNPVELSAILRSWEDRTGTYLLEMAPNLLGTWTNRLPTATDDFHRWVGELVAFCPSQFFDAGSVGDLLPYMRDPLGACLW